MNYTVGDRVRAADEYDFITSDIHGKVLTVEKIELAGSHIYVSATDDEGVTYFNFYPDELELAA